MPEIIRLIRQALSPGIGLGLPEPETPWPGEDLPQAVPARLAEFRQGRAAARAAMRTVGLPAAPVPANPDRSPQWPEGVLGSISHCEGACLAIVGRAGDWTGMGIDLEPARPMESDLWPTIVEPHEIALLPELDPAIAVLWLFVAKEAAYKAQFAQSGQLIDFHALRADATIDGTIQLRFTRPVSPFAEGDVMDVQMFSADGLVAGLCLLARPAPKA